MARVGKLEDRKRFARMVRIIDGIKVRCAVIPVYQFDGILKTSRTRRLKINALMAQRQYYRRRLDGKIKQINRLIERIDKSL